VISPCIWKPKVPSKEVFFAWTASLGKILMIDNLCMRKLWILDWCYMCKCSRESVDHLLLHCPIAVQLWSMVFTLFGLYWVMPKSVVDLLACWQGKFGRHRNNISWMAVPPCLMWCIWLERNNWCFEDFERTVIDLKLLFFKTLLYWMSIVENHSISSNYDLMNACNLCS